MKESPWALNYLNSTSCPQNLQSLSAPGPLVFQTNAGQRGQRSPEEVDVSVPVLDLVIPDTPGALLPTDDPHLLDLSCIQTYQREKNTTQALFIKNPGTSLVVQWLRIRLPVQGTRVQSLVWEDSTCFGATKPKGHNY